MNGNMNLGTRLSRLENGGGGGSQNKGHVYSTEEQIVGKWVDGRNVYERTISGTLVGTNGAWLDIGITIDNVDIFLTTDKGIKNPAKWDRIEDRINVSIVPSSGKLQVNQNISTENVQFTFYAVIHYIKKS